MNSMIKGFIPPPNIKSCSIVHRIRYPIMTRNVLVQALLIISLRRSSPCRITDTSIHTINARDRKNTAKKITRIILLAEFNDMNIRLPLLFLSNPFDIFSITESACFVKYILHFNIRFLNFFPTVQKRALVL